MRALCIYVQIQTNVPPSTCLQQPDGGTHLETGGAWLTLLSSLASGPLQRHTWPTHNNMATFNKMGLPVSTLNAWATGDTLHGHLGQWNRFQQQQGIMGNEDPTKAVFWDVLEKWIRSEWETRRETDTEREVYLQRGPEVQQHQSLRLYRADPEWQRESEGLRRM